MRYLVGFAMMLACTPKPAAPAEPVPPTSTSADLPAEPIAAAPPTEPAAPATEPADAPAQPPIADTTGCSTRGCFEVAEAVAKMKLFADQMCACKGRGKPCAEDVTAAMVQYGEDMARRHEGKAEPPVTDAQKRDMEEAMQRLTACVTEVMTK